ncbi:MAG: hypothetical protein AAF604_15230 [Acidobacteriota bacterium]
MNSQAPSLSRGASTLRVARHLLLAASLLALTTSIAAARPPAIAASPQAPGDFGRPHPEAAEELSQFAFLIGRWSCDLDYLNPDLTTRTQSQGTWTAYYALDGHAIMDDFRGGFGEGYIATTFRAFNRQDKRWNGYWLDGRRGFWSQPLVGAMRGDEMLLETRIKARNSAGEIIDLDLEYNFYDIQKDRFRWRQHTSFDGKKTWRKETMRIDCRRVLEPET